MSREGRTVLCYKTASVRKNTLNKHQKCPLSVTESLQCVHLFSLVCVCVSACVLMRTLTSAVLHTLLAATLHRLLHVLRKRGPIVAFEGEPPAPDPQRRAAGGGGDAWLTSCLTPTPTFNPGERFGRLAEDGATLQSVVIPDRFSSAQRLCERRHRDGFKKVQASEVKVSNSI